jgi:diguanylate cyclase (GGDEF)-like protein
MSGDGPAERRLPSIVKTDTPPSVSQPRQRIVTERRAANDQRISEVVRELQGMTPEEGASRVVLLERKLELAKRRDAFDQTTGLLSRKVFDYTLRIEVGQMERERERPGLRLVLNDIDGFKTFNDKYGHSAGDEVLRSVGDVIKKNMREETDTAGREGGDETGIIEPITVENPGDPGDPFGSIEKLRSSVENIQLQSGEKVTISIGVSEYIRGEGRKAFYNRVDIARRTAKYLGKNRIVHAYVHPKQGVVYKDLSTGEIYAVSVNEKNEILHVRKVVV